MRYLHTMLRVRNLDQALDFYVNKLGLQEARRRVDEKNRYTLVFLAAPEDESRVEESKRTGRDAPLGSPGGASQVGPLPADTPLVASLPPQAGAE